MKTAGAHVQVRTLAKYVTASHATLLPQGPRTTRGEGVGELDEEAVPLRLAGRRDEPTAGFVVEVEGIDVSRTKVVAAAERAGLKEGGASDEDVVGEVGVDGPDGWRRPVVRLRRGACAHLAVRRMDM